MDKHRGSTWNVLSTTLSHQNTNPQSMDYLYGLRPLQSHSFAMRLTIFRAISRSHNEGAQKSLVANRFMS